MEIFECYAWIGEDEMGSGEIGIKGGITPAGYIPLVAVDREKISRPEIVAQLQIIANKFGKSRQLVRLVYVEEVQSIEPE